jgi:hypothetical protein
VQIVVNHLTRMTAPRICVAGIEPDSRRHIRPTTPANDPIDRRLLDEEGGPFGIGTLVDLGAVRANRSRPESEDHLFETASAREVRSLDPDEYWQLLDDVAEDNLGAIFGPDLERRGGSFAIEEGSGRVSLGVLRVQQPPDLRIDGYGKLRLILNDVEEPARLPVTDIRFVEAEHRTLRREVVADVQQRLRGGTDLFLMLGLARAFVAEGDDRGRHWLQVNGICVEDRPVGGHAVRAILGRALAGKLARQPAGTDARWRSARGSARFCIRPRRPTMVCPRGCL